MRIITTLAILSVSMLSLTAQVSIHNFGKGIHVYGKDSTFHLRFGFRFQNLFTSEWASVDGNLQDPSANFLVRRSRLKFDGFAYSPKLKYKLELGLTNRDIGGGGLSEFNDGSRVILDAFITWNFYKNWSIKFGQAKLPGNRERVISSANMQTVDRSRLNSRFNIDRDVGIQLLHHAKLGKDFIIRELFSFSQGEGRNLTAGNLGGFDYTFRVEFLPFGTFASKGDYIGSAIKKEEKPKLSVGLTYDINVDAVKERGQLGRFIRDNTGAYVGKTLQTFFADLMYKHRDFSVMAEYAHKKTEDDIPDVTDSEGNVIGTFYTGSAISVQAGYFVSKTWEVIGRYTGVDPDEGVSNNENEYTLGLNKYIVDHKLKVQTDVIYRNVHNRDNKLFWRVQMDIHF